VAEGDRFDLWDPAHRADPHTLYHQMRVEAPVFAGIGPVTGRRFWLLTRCADCAAALKAPHEVLGKEFDKHLDADQIAARPAAEGAFEILNRNLLSVDPPLLRGVASLPVRA
jgi:cytochrome P450